MSQVHHDGSFRQKRARALPLVHDPIQGRTTLTLALKRLYLEYQEVKEFPMSHVSACPSPKKKKAPNSMKPSNKLNLGEKLDDDGLGDGDDLDLMVWHLNIKGPVETIYEGAVFHAVMRFSEKYPLEAPTITLCTRMEHPNVVDGNRICLDFLNVGEWKPIYSVHSILMQLQTFLYDGADIARVLSSIQDPKTFDEKKEEYMSAQEWSIAHAKNYACRKVGHSNHLPSPPLVSEKEDDGMKRFNCESVEKVLASSDSACFFTKTSELVGYGIDCKKRNAKSLEICSMKCSLDIVSLRAFMNYKVRGMTKENKFTNWIPIISVGENNLEKVISLAKSSISNMCGSALTRAEFSEDQVLEILPRLMSNCLLQVLDSREKSTNSLLASLRIFRLMAELIKQLPNLGKLINDSIGKFIQKDENRSKQTVRDLMDFVMMIPFSKFSWNNLNEVFVREYMTRSIKKILKSYSEIADMDCTEINDEDRLTFSFKVIRKRLKELLIHIYFIQLFDRFDNVEGISKFMEENHGILPYRSIDLFVEKLNQIEKINSYSNFFTLLNEISQNQLFNTKESVIELLKSSIIHSKQKGYHGQDPTNFQKPLELNKLPTHTNEELWENDCYSRWKIHHLPYYMKDMNDAWKQLYLQKSMAETFRKMIVRRDFSLFSKLLEMYSESKCLELYWFSNSDAYIVNILNTLSVSTIVFSDKLKCSKEDVRRSLSTSILTIAQWERRDRIENLIFSNCNLAPDLVSILSYSTFKNLKVIDFRNNDIGDEGAGIIAKYFRNMRYCPNLTYIDLSFCNIGESGTKLIADSLICKQKLKTFKYDGNSSSHGLDTVAHGLSHSYTIERLDLTHVKDPNKSNISVTNFNQLFSNNVSLKKVDMSYCEIPDIPYSVCTSYSYMLEDLNLRGSPCNPKSLIYLFMWSNVKNKINLSSNCEISNENLTSEFKRIVEYTGGWHKINEKTKIIKFKDLNLSENNLHATSIEQTNPLDMILKYSTIRRLNISKCSLQVLDLDIIGGALLMKNVPHLQHLIMRQNKFKRHDLRPLVLPLQENITLQTLDISGNRIGLIGTRYISSIMKQNKSIKYLNMFACLIDLQGTFCLLDGLKENNTIEMLDLGLNKIRNRGFSSLIDFVKNNTKITRLSLSQNGLNNSESFNEAMSLMKDRSQLFINMKKNQFVNPLQGQKIANIENHVIPVIEVENQQVAQDWLFSTIFLFLVVFILGFLCFRYVVQ